MRRRGAGSLTALAGRWDAANPGQASSFFGASLLSVNVCTSYGQGVLYFYSEFHCVLVSQWGMIFFLVNRLPESRPKLAMNMDRRFKEPRGMRAPAAILNDAISIHFCAFLVLLRKPTARRNDKLIAKHPFIRSSKALLNNLKPANSRAILTLFHHRAVAQDRETGHRLGGPFSQSD